jgi:hypothetical protein
MQYAPTQARGIHFLPSMVVGVLIAGPIVALISHLYRRKRIELKATAAGLPGKRSLARCCFSLYPHLKMVQSGTRVV